MTERRAFVAAFGGPEAIRFENVELPHPAAGEVRMRNTAVGLNFIDTYHRSGLYPQALPAGLGIEAAGVIEAVGEGVDVFLPGDRVCTFGPVTGAYATARNIDARLLLRTPDDVSDEMAAAALLKGCTVEFLVERCGKVQPGWTVLVHAAAGGVGLLLVQWLKHVGAVVIATVGTPVKAELARKAGADHVIEYRHEDIAARVHEITHGHGVPVVFDGVGMATWEASLKSCARRGLLVSFGNASGAVTGVGLGSLSTAGSLFVTRPTLFDYYREPVERVAGAARLFAMLSSGALSVTIGQRFALEDVARAHLALEAGETNGSTLLLP